jgi:hypothetical protein
MTFCNWSLETEGQYRRTHYTSHTTTAVRLAYSLSLLDPNYPQPGLNALWQLGIPPASATATCHAETLVKFTAATSTLQSASTITVSLRDIKTCHRLGNKPSMEHRPSRKGNRPFSNHEFLYLWNRKMNCRVHYSPPHVHIPTHINPVHALPRYFCDLHAVVSVSWLPITFKTLLAVKKTYSEPINYVGVV